MRAALRMDGVKEIVEKLQAEGDDADDDEGEDALSSIGEAATGDDKAANGAALCSAKASAGASRRNGKKVEVALPKTGEARLRCRRQRAAAEVAEGACQGGGGGGGEKCER